MKICCSSGKARIYYNIPLNGGLKYKLKGQTKWQLITANEKLISSCIDIPNVFKGGQCSNKLYRLNFAFTDNSGHTDTKICEIVGKITSIASVVHWSPNGSYNFHFWQVFNDSGNMVEVQCNGYNAENLGGGFNIGPINLYNLQGVERADGTSQADDIAQCGGDRPTKRFTVTGESTGTKYLELDVKECPDVQQAGCVFDPKNEQTITVELAFFDAPILRNIPGFPNALPTTLRDCVEVVTQDNAIQIRKVGEIGYYVGENLVWIPTGLFSVVKQVDSPQGCPPPKVKIECEGDPKDRSKKCPPETDCEIVCKGFKCCYSKGKAIKVIPV